MYKGWIDSVSAARFLADGWPGWTIKDTYRVRACLAGKPSVCGRNVVHLSVALRRFLELPDNIQESYFEAFTDGINKDCANSEFYLPRNLSHDMVYEESGRI